MALSPEEAKQKASGAAIAAGEEQVQVFLKRNIRNLALIYQDDGLKIPEATEALEKLAKVPADQRDEEYQKKVQALEAREKEIYGKMARDLIDKRRFTIGTKNGGTKTITVDELDRKDSEQKLGIKSSYGVKTLHELLPTREQLNTIGETIGDGVREKTGEIPLLGGATFLNAMAGLVQWVMDGGLKKLFTEGFAAAFDDLKKTIAQVSAESMQNTVTGNLDQLKASRPDMAYILTDKNISNIGDQVHHSVLNEAGISSATPSGPLALRDVTPEGLDGTKLRMVNQRIKEEVLNPPGEKPLREGIAEKYAKATNDNNASRYGINPLKWVGAGVVTKEQAMPIGKKAADIIASAVADAITDPDFRDRNGRTLLEIKDDPKKFATAIADKAGDELLKHEKELKALGMKASLNDKGADGKTTRLESIKADIREKITAKHAKLADVVDTVNQGKMQEVTSTIDKSKLAADVAYNPDPKGQVAGELSRQNGGARTPDSGVQLS